MLLLWLKINYIKNNKQNTNNKMSAPQVLVICFSGTYPNDIAQYLQEQGLSAPVVSLNFDDPLIVEQCCHVNYLSKFKVIVVCTFAAETTCFEVSGGRTIDLGTVLAEYCDGSYGSLLLGLCTNCISEAGLLGKFFNTEVSAENETRNRSRYHPLPYSIRYECNDAENDEAIKQNDEIVFEPSSYTIHPIIKGIQRITGGALSARFPCKHLDDNCIDSATIQPPANKYPGVSVLSYWNTGDIMLAERVMTDSSNTSKIVAFNGCLPSNRTYQYSWPIYGSDTALLVKNICEYLLLL